MSFARECILGGHAARITALQLSPCGTMLASGDGNGTISLWKYTRGNGWLRTSQSLLAEEGDPITYLDFSPCGERLVGTSYQGHLRVCTTTNGEPLPISEDQRVDVLGTLLCSATFTPDGSEIVTVAFRRDNHHTHLFRMDGQNGALKSIGLENGLAAQNNEILERESDTKARIWRRGQRAVTVRTLEDAPGGAYYWTPNGILVCVSDGKNIRVWIPSSTIPSLRAVTDSPAEPPHMHFPRCCFSYVQESVLGTYQRNGEMVLWDLLSGARIKLTDAPPTPQHRLIPHAIHAESGWMAYAEHRSSSIHMGCVAIPPQIPTSRLVEMATLDPEIV